MAGARPAGEPAQHAAAPEVLGRLPEAAAGPGPVVTPVSGGVADVNVPKDQVAAIAAMIATRALGHCAALEFEVRKTMRRAEGDVFPRFADFHVSEANPEVSVQGLSEIDVRPDHGGDKQRVFIQISAGVRKAKDGQVRYALCTAYFPARDMDAAVAKLEKTYGQRLKDPSPRILQLPKGKDLIWRVGIPGAPHTGVVETLTLWQFSAAPTFFATYSLSAPYK